MTLSFSLPICVPADLKMKHAEKLLRFFCLHEKLMTITLPLKCEAFVVFHFKSKDIIKISVLNYYAVLYSSKITLEGLRTQRDT